MKIWITSLFVDDQAKALDFYTNKLGFQKKSDEPMGPYRWLTVVAPNDVNGIELLLEPDAHKAVSPFMRQLKNDGIPAASFEVEDVASEVERLQSLQVAFTQMPTHAGEVVIAILDDTCGNLIQLIERTT